jgi:hypothetical protein
MCYHNKIPPDTTSSSIMIEEEESHYTFKELEFLPSSLPSSMPDCGMV